MTNPTSNFGWQMPTATDLVTDLPADFEVFGQAVDTDFVDLLGGTTGQILSKTSATDLDFTWINNDQGDITGVTAGVGMTVANPTGPVPTVTNDMATTITASGDIVVGTGSGTYDNLPIGTTNQVLTADTSVSPYKVKWATASSGGMTLLSTTSLSGATTTISSISQDYISLKMYITGVTNATGNGNFQISPNSLPDLNAVYLIGDNASVESYGNSILRLNYQTLPNTDAQNVWVVTFENYTSTTRFKPFQVTGYYDTGNNRRIFIAGSWYRTAALSSLVFSNTGGNLSTGTVLLYGVK
jgi:hypothetical protein